MAAKGLAQRPAHEYEKDVLMMNGYEIQTSVFSIDMRDQLGYLTFQFG